MVAQLHQFCEINTGTYNLNGLKMMHQTLKSIFIPLADSVETRTFKKITTINMAGEKEFHQSGDGLLIRKRPHLKRRVLLCGHMDTVYSETNPFKQLRYLNNNHIIGPGVADMKGGLIVMLHALMAFEKTPFSESMGWDVFINADEEIGSPASSEVFKEIAKNYQCALVFEPAMTESGKLAKNRKGSGKVTLIATGKAAHAGRAFDKGHNAICYLAEVITAINTLNGKRPGVTINIGKIAGGEALNVVPEKAVAKIDIRISQPEDEKWVRDEFAAILNQHKRKGFNLVIDGNFGRPVKRVDKSTEILFKKIQWLGKELNISIDWEDSGGCCDGNNLASLGLPVLDTLGVRGGEIHSSKEYLVMDSLVERASLNALLLVDLAQGGLEELR